MTLRRRVTHHLAKRLKTRLGTCSDDRGSLAMAMIAILVAGMLGALMLPMVISQSRSTRFDITRVHALHAAQAGADVAMGLVKASTTTDSEGFVWGDPVKLPCFPASKPLTGIVGGSGNGAYTVTVSYWATLPASGGSPMVCADKYGTYDPISSTATPHYAVITSTGTDGVVDSGSQGRTLVSTYVFQTDDTNIPGGQFRLFPSTGATDKWCMDAGSAIPTSGTPVVLRACSTSAPSVAQQVFAYRSDLSIQLVSSVTKSTPNGLCLDTSPTAHTPGGVISIQLITCVAPNPSKCADVTQCSPYNQQWSVNDSAHLEGALSDKSNTDNYCINAAGQAAGTPLTLTTCAGGTSDPSQTWVPSPTAGAGMAGASNNQLVNYKQFATCLDVTDQKPSSTYLILYTCKQNPNPTRVAWNQRFTPSPSLAAAPATVLLKTTTGGTSYCLRSPLSDTAPAYVTVTSACPTSATGTGAYSWTVNQSQDAAKNDLPYAQKYTIVDSSGLCLALSSNSDLLNGTYLKAVVGKCDGSTGQKWNANSSLDSSRITGTHEVG